MKTVYAFFADGMEEVEAMMVIDLLRRTKRLNVVTVSIKEELMIESSHGIRLFADKNIDEIDFKQGDCIFLPGGMPGTTNLSQCKVLADEILKYNSEHKLLTAICAAPSIYGQLGLLKDKKATCYPSFADKMDCKEYGGSVVKDDNFITANGLGAALELGLEIIATMLNGEEAEKVANAIQYIG